MPDTLPFSQRICKADYFEYLQSCVVYIRVCLLVEFFFTAFYWCIAKLPCALLPPNINRWNSVGVYNMIPVCVHVLDKNSAGYSIFKCLGV